MKKVFVAITALIMLQFTMVSCEDNADIIQDDKAQVEQDFQKTEPVNGGGGDDDDEEGDGG